jgi:hypothetical protein
MQKEGWRRFRVEMGKSTKSVVYFSFFAQDTVPSLVRTRRVLIFATKPASNTHQRKAISKMVKNSLGGVSEKGCCLILSLQDTVELEETRNNMFLYAKARKGVVLLR